MTVGTAFRPSVHGWRFRNRFAFSPRLGPVRVPLNLSFGFCGGMAYAALDRFHAGMPTPARTDIPEQGDALYAELYRRQRESLADAVWWKVHRWQRMPDEEIGARTAEEWERVRRGLDVGVPQVVCLIRVRGWTGNISLNHQVVAYAYDAEDDSGRVQLRIYDPNHAGRDDVWIAFSPGGPSNRIHGVQSTGEPMRGFFLMSYAPDPPG